MSKKYLIIVAAAALSLTAASAANARGFGRIQTHPTTFKGTQEKIVRDHRGEPHQYANPSGDTSRSWIRDHRTGRCYGPRDGGFDAAHFYCNF